ncbi:MAG: lipid II flippase MurJ, partial [Bacteroidales bacterium]|nr:lipid II flippase MurJ [Bacteroidales bacterium]
MLKGILSVGGFTLLSRVTGFVRDVVLAAVLGAGPLNDAFLVALRLPNHFRAIFAEGAFNAAFVPAYARAREEDGEAEARAFAGRILTLLVLATGLITALAMAFTPQVIDLLAPGFAGDAGRFELATALTRITFPYLVFISVVTLLGGMLNAHKRFAAAAGAPILLNVAIVAALASAALFPTAAHAAAWGVFAAGIG